MERHNDEAGSLGINKPILQDLHSKGETLEMELDSGRSGQGCQVKFEISDTNS